jgi:hypothetical protein
MKTLYLIKSVLPFVFLPIAPGVLQLELARQGLLGGGWAIFVIAGQGIFTLATIAWLGVIIARQRRTGFLRMSCVSKKVFFQGQWMTVEQYLAEHHNVQVSHGMTPEESKAWVADAEEYVRRETVSLPNPQHETVPLPEVVEAHALPDYEHSAA